MKHGLGSLKGFFFFFLLICTLCKNGHHTFVFLLGWSYSKPGLIQIYIRLTHQTLGVKTDKVELTMFKITSPFLTKEVLTFSLSSCSYGINLRDN